MTFEYTDELKQYMVEKNHKNIVVELVMCNNTEFEIAELHVHFVNEERYTYFREKEGYGIATTEVGHVLLPRYKLKYKDVVTFGLKKVLFWHVLTYDGIKVER